MEESVFTKIIKGEIPSYKVHESERSLAIMDINPIQNGQVLIMSKRQVENFYELPDKEYQDFMQTVKEAAIKLRSHFPSKHRIAVIIEGLDVPHVHAKVFPIDSGDDLRHIPEHDNDPDHKALAELAKKLAF